VPVAAASYNGGIMSRQDAKTIYEFFGIEERKHAVQLVKHFDEVPDSKKRYPLMAQVKKDGIFAAVAIVGYTATIFGRTGKRLSNVELQEQDFFQVMFERTLPEIPQGVFIAELCSKDCSLEVLSGIVNPNRNKPLTDEQKKIKENMYLCFHDYVTVSEFVMGHSELPYIKREERLLKFIPERQVLRSYLCYDEKDVTDFADLCIKHGEEGAVFKDIAAGWDAGHKGWHATKIVRGVEYDLECIGYEEGKGKYAGKVANLLFRFRDGETIKAMLGRGWTHEDARNMYIDLQAACEAFNGEAPGPVGRIYRVTALQESSTGKKLRLPKVGEERHDKEQPDF